MRGLSAAVLVSGLALGAFAAPATAATFTNSAPFDVADGSGADAPYTPGTGAQYPSTIAASGLDGTVSDVNVTLHGVTHTRPDDLDVMLEGPGGQRVVLVSDSGENTPMSSEELTFDDSAGASAPDTTAMPSGTYKPTNNFGGFGEPSDGNDPFAPPAPGPPRSATLAEAFNGTDPNGTWRLYVVDDRPGETGSLSGWSVEIQTSVAPAPGAAPAPPQAGAPVRAGFVPLGQSANQRLHRTVSIDASSSLVGDPHTARLSWDVNGDGRSDANCGGEQPRLDVHVLGRARSVPVTLTVENGGATSRVARTIPVPNRVGLTQAGAAALGSGTVRALEKVDSQLLRAGKRFSLTCSPPPGSFHVGDLTDNGGPGIGCATSVTTGIIDAIGCLRGVESLFSLPDPERKLLVKTNFRLGPNNTAPGRASAAALGGPIPRSFGSNPYGRVDAFPPEMVTSPAAVVAEFEPHFSTRAVRVNGIDFIPQPGASIVIYPLGDLVASSNAVVKLGSATIYSGQLVWRLPDKKRNHLGDFELAGTLGRAAGDLAAQGRVGLDFGRHVSIVNLNARLPRPFTDLDGRPVTGATTLTLDNQHGLRGDGAVLRVAQGRVGGVEIGGATLRLDPGAGTWTGPAPVYLPPGDAYRDGGTIGLRGGQLDFFRMQTGPFTAGGVLNYGGVDLVDSFAGGFALQGPLGASIKGNVPFLGGGPCPVAGVAGNGRLTGAPGSGSRVDAAGNVSVLCIGAAGGRFTALENGDVQASGALRFDLVKDAIFLEATVQGHVKGPHFQANGSARACIRILVKLCKGADAVFSDTGIGACTDVGLPGVLDFVSVRVGGGVRFLPPTGPRLFTASCDLGPFSSFLARASANTLHYKKGLKAAMVEVQGRGGAPSVTLTGPRGRKLVTPPSGTSRDRGGYLLDRDAQTSTTYILMSHPAGAWTVSADPGSPQIARISSAASIPAPQVRARVSGRGARRRLTYDIRRIPGQKVVFTEVGARTSGRIGTARGGRGALRFTPAAGRAGRRRIIATVEQSGLPRAARTVARYRASPTLPGRSRRVTLRRRGSTVRVRWRRVATAVRYRVTARLSDGRRQTIVVGRTTATLTKVPPSGKGIVSVRAVDSAHRVGRPRTARLRARPRPRPKSAKRRHKAKRRR